MRTSMPFRAAGPILAVCLLAAPTTAPAAAAAAARAARQDAGTGADVAPAPAEAPRADTAPAGAVPADGEPVEAAAAPSAQAAPADASPSGLAFGPARQTLQDVLAHGNFEKIDRSNSWTVALQRWIARQLTRLLDGLTGTHVPTETIGRLLAWGLALGALAALAVWLLRLRRTTVRHPAIEAAALPRLSSREWALRARAALRTGDAREALRSAYHAALFRLEEQGLWQVDASRTPREYLSLLPAGDARQAALVSLTRDFEVAWYGSRAADVSGLLERLEVFGCALPPESTT